ncbi:MAG: hypothetical protein KDJ88_02115 [Bauldia sp.]|nr:hypothetical protein [Bauldia sp.]
MAKIDALAEAEKARRVVAVSVWCGALSHMTEAHFGEHFRQSAAGTIAEGARLDVTLSTDISDPNAQDVLLESIEIEG